MEGPERISSGLGLVLWLLPLLWPGTRMGCVALSTSRGSFGRCLGSTSIWLFRGLWLGRLCSVRRRLSARGVCLWGSVNLAVSCAQSIGVVFEPLLGITEDFIGSLNGLEPGNELLFLARVPVRMVLEC